MQLVCSVCMYVWIIMTEFYELFTFSSFYFCCCCCRNFLPFCTFPPSLFLLRPCLRVWLLLSKYHFIKSGANKFAPIHTMQYANQLNVYTRTLTCLYDEISMQNCDCRAQTHAHRASIMRHCIQSYCNFNELMINLSWDFFPCIPLPFIFINAIFRCVRNSNNFLCYVFIETNNSYKNGPIISENLVRVVIYVKWLLALSICNAISEHSTE